MRRRASIVLFCVALVITLAGCGAHQGPPARPSLSTAWDHLEHGRRVEARVALNAAWQAGGQTDWVGVARAHQATLSPTRAVAAARRSGDPSLLAEVDAWAQSLRGHLGLPPGAVPPELEGNYADAVEVALAVAQGGDAKATENALAPAEAVYPGGPGITATRCTLAATRGESDRARSLCAAALAAYPDTLPALLVIALLDESDRRDLPAARGLARVVELAPRRPAAWEALARIHQRGRNGAALGVVRARYRALFARDLPDSVR
jgi:hypothetical protein